MARMAPKPAEKAVPYSTEAARLTRELTSAADVLLEEAMREWRARAREVVASVEDRRSWHSS